LLRGRDVVEETAALRHFNLAYFGFPSHVRSRQVRTKWTALKGMATLEGMSSHYNFRPGQRNKLVSEPPIAAPDEHAPLVEADQRFRTALGQAIAAGGERIEAVKATVQLKRRTKLPR
jgi:hypothetical protein